MGDAIDLHQYRIMKQAEKLLASYSASLHSKNFHEVHPLVIHWLKEYELNPNHILTLVKGRDTLNRFLSFKLTPEMQTAADKALERCLSSLAARQVIKTQTGKEPPNDVA